MKGTIIFFLVIIGVILLWVMKPWEGSRYDSSKQGQQAKRIDKKVDQAIAWPNIWEARDFLKSQPTDKVSGEKILAFSMSYDECSKLVESLYSAGATDVEFCYITRGVRSGDQPEGLYAVMPKDPKKRKALIQIAQSWPHPPKDVNQKYIYRQIQGWDVDEPEKSLLGD